MGKLAVAVIVSSWVIPISLMVNQIVPEPYMDEIFHIPQAQQYCKGNFRSWDPMITTPPGLYYLSLAHVASLFPGMWCANAIPSISEMCSSAMLRSVNGVLAVGCSLLVHEILTQSRPTLSEKTTTLITIILSLYPLHWFFSFLYYTDVASLAVVLAMYLACLKQHFRLSAVFGVLAILIRQTNIVWMLFVACTGVIDLLLPQNNKQYADLDDHDLSIKKANVVVDKKSKQGAPTLRKRKPDKSSSINHSMPTLGTFLHRHASGLLGEVQEIIPRLWDLKWKLLVSFGPFFLVLVGFAAFVLWNGSIVLGAKEAHKVSPHFAQIMYFGLVSSLALAPFTFSLDQASNFCQSFKKIKLASSLILLIGLISGFLCVHFFSIAHPYLLADNRHYTFYIWRKVINSHWLMKYLLLPLYVYSWLSIFGILGKLQKKIWLLAFFLACAAVLVPAPLIEFRYYTIPFYFLVLRSHLDGDRSWFFLGIIYTAVNVFTMTMFLFRPFHWNHEPGTQRFIW